MPESFNPYQTWLGLNPQESSPDYFQLLGIDSSEEDSKTIASAADKAASKVRRCRPGNHASEWAALLDEIAAAKKCLTDPQTRSQYLQTKAAPSKGAARPTSKTSSKTNAGVNPNLYPPGAVPANQSKEIVAEEKVRESSRAMPAGDRVPTTPSRTLAPTKGQPANANSSSAVPSDAIAPWTPPTSRVADPQAPIVAESGPTPSGLPTTNPAGVPYLQPASPAGDPMRSADPAMDAYSPYAPNTNSLDPMAPPQLPYAAPLAGGPTAGNPMAAIPVAMPVGTDAIHAAQAIPYPSQAFPGAVGPEASSFEDPSSSSTSPMVNQATAAVVVAAKRRKSGAGGPILLGGSIGLVLLAIVGAVYYVQSQKTSSVEIADNDPPEAPSSSSNAALPASESAPPAVVAPRSPAAPREIELVAPPDAGITDGATGKEAMKSETESSNDSPDSTPATTEPKPEAKPTPDPTSTPAPTTATPAPIPEPEDLPKPTAEELAKLGRAMQKARDAIGAQEFEKADAFIELASELPRLPQHQAMLDRLKLLSESVKQYQQAIQTSLGQLSSGSSFKVGEAMVGVVETGPEKLIFRANGQNRSYTMTELPVGLASALAAQTLPPDDPQTLMLKGAYVFASPKASAEDLKKAREFLETASASVEPAKELLLLFSDKYDLKPEK